jgi:hypothetical protein
VCLVTFDTLPFVQRHTPLHFHPHGSPGRENLEIHEKRETLTVVNPQSHINSNEWPVFVLHVAKLLGTTRMVHKCVMPKTDSDFSNKPTGKLVKAFHGLTLSISNLGLTLTTQQSSFHLGYTSTVRRFGLVKILAFTIRVRIHRSPHRLSISRGSER